MKQENKKLLKNGEKYKITDSIMMHLIGKTVTIKNFRETINGKNFYNVTIDNMNDCPLVCSDKVLKKI